MTTENQIIANQQNSQLSTGPHNTVKTRFNAIKHNIFTKELVLANENIEDYKYIFNKFVKEYGPQTITEQVLINKMVNCVWRSLRILKAEKQALTPQETAKGDEVIARIFKTELALYEAKTTNTPFVMPQTETQNAPKFNMDLITISQYELNLDKQFYRALAELERIKKERNLKNEAKIYI